MLVELVLLEKNVLISMERLYTKNGNPKSCFRVTMNLYCVPKRVKICHWIIVIVLNTYLLLACILKVRISNRVKMDWVISTYHPFSVNLSVG